MQMYCFSCRRVMEFTVVDPKEGPVCECGHWQISEAQGAAGICLLATWHDLDEYKRVAKIARSGGYTIPNMPNYYKELNNAK